MAEPKQLACPRCGRENLVTDDRAFACAHCRGMVRRAPHGKAYLLLPVDGVDAPTDEAAREAEAILQQALATEDPVKKKALLRQGEQLAPTYLPIQEELLHLGDLDQRGRRPLDYHLIKCYLLHMFEAPTEVEPRIPAMVAELTAHPQLNHCLSLTSDQDGFIRRYLIRLSRAYIHVFLMGSNRHIPRIFGFPTKSPDQALGYPAARMIQRMKAADLPSPFDVLLPQSFVDAYRQEVGSDVHLEKARKELGV